MKTRLNIMTRNLEDLDDLWEEREAIAETEYTVSVFEHLDEKDEDEQEREE